MKILHYKGIVFDNFEQNDDGTFWGEICNECAKKHYNKIKGEIDEGGTAIGCCSVKGCFNSGENDEKMHYYIDFDPKYTTVKEVNKNAYYDEQYI